MRLQLLLVRGHAALQQAGGAGFSLGVLFGLAPAGLRGRIHADLRLSVHPYGLIACPGEEIPHVKLAGKMLRGDVMRWCLVVPFYCGMLLTSILVPWTYKPYFIAI